MNARKSVLLLILIFFWTAHCLQAQQNGKTRPSVGVALSGGGALGLAHIGVIRYFEEHRIPIDDLAGTSMGGLVGGFYAAGMDSTQMTEVVEHADWNALLSPNPRFIDQPVVEKQREHRSSGNLTLRFGKNFSLPAGLNPGESLSLMLSRNTAAYSDLRDFDELPTRFRCVATDLVTGDAVVLHQGSLAKALRATMSIPAIFTPVRWDNMVLVDGGIVENIPVEVVREMGPNVVIAVSLETEKPKPEQFKSLTEVLRQTASIAILQNERRSLALADVVISVDTTRFSGTDYGKYREIIAAGYAAARAKGKELEKYQLSPEEWEKFLIARRQRIRHSERQGKVLSVVATNPSFQKNAEEEIRRKTGGAVITEKKLEEVLTGMVAATAVPGAAYSWQHTAAGEEGYKVEFSQRPGDQVLAEPWIEYGYSPGEPSRTEVKLSITTIFQDVYKSRLIGTASIGYDPGFRMEYYRPFGGNAFFVAPELFVDRQHFISYEGPQRRSDTRDRFGGAIYGGIGTWRFAQLRLGVRAGYDSFSTSPIVDGVRADDGGFVAPEVRWIYDSQNSGGFPTRGTRIEGSAGYSFRQASHPYLQNDFSTFHPLSRRVLLFGKSHAGTSFGSKLDFFEQFTAGGQDRLSAFRYQEFHANTLVTGSGGVIIRGPSVRSFSVYPSLAMWYEAGRFDLGSQGWQTHQSANSGIFFPTPLGATGVALSVNEAGKLRFRVIVGSF